MLPREGLTRGEYGESLCSSLLGLPEQGVVDCRLNTRVPPRSSGGWRAEMEVSAEEVSLRLVDGHVLPVSLCGLSLVCVYVQISPSYKNTGHNGLGPTLITLKKLILLSMGLLSWLRL